MLINARYKENWKNSSNCETQLLQFNLNHCMYTEPKIRNHVKFIPTINAHLLSLFSPTVLHIIQGPDSEILDSLSGILLLNATDVTMNIFNKTFRNSISSHGKFLIISKPHFEINSKQILPLTLDT